MNATMSPELPMTGGQPIPKEPNALSRSNRSLPFFQQAYQCFCVAALALASYFLISHFVIQSVKIVGMSMFPTLADADHYLLNRWVYMVRPPHRTEEVVLRDPADHGFSVKRVIAVAGDSVLLKEGKVFVN